MTASHEVRQAHVSHAVHCYVCARTQANESYIVIEYDGTDATGAAELKYIDTMQQWSFEPAWTSMHAGQALHRYTLYRVMLSTPTHARVEGLQQQQ